jgi:hypothetical protein
MNAALALATLLTLLTAAGQGQAVTRNGFDLEGAAVPVNEIVSGGPPRDGIPALNLPERVAADQADFIQADDRVLGVEVQGEARAYPIKILNWHEIVNDRIGTQHFVVTYCPLCGSGMVFASNAGDTALVFGVSGLLYNSDMLLFDRNTESLWTQIGARAISGKLEGTELPQLPAFHTTWADWVARHPDTEVLSIDTGYRRNYERSPYAGYERSRRLYFQVSERAPDDFHPKALVLGVGVNGEHKAYPFQVLAGVGREMIADTVGGQPVTVHWNPAAESAHVTDAAGRMLPATTAYWFAWYAFHPDTAVYEPAASP